MKKIRLISFILAAVLLFNMVIPCAASSASYASGGYVEVFDGDVIQNQFSTEHTVGKYTITATDTKYYKFTFDNQSVELRTGISIADSFVNLFFGKINIQITDAYDQILSEFSVRCGYSGNVTLKLTKGSTYYIKVSSNLSGFYRMKVNSYADIGGETWDAATETLSVGQMISSIDASGDKDWFYFQTDDTDSFYKFRLENIGGSSNMYMHLYEYVPGAGQTPLRETLYIYAGSSSSGSNEVKLKPNTKYYMCVSLNSGVGGYQLDITQTLDAVGDTQDTAYSIATDTNVTTALDGKGDVDWYKFTTKAYDAYYYFNIDDLSLNENAYVYIYDADGNELKYNWGSGDFSANVKLSPNTEYYFKIYCSYSGTGNYSFTITDIPDPYANNLENAGEIHLNQTVSESISGAYDVDFFKFTTEAKDAYYYFNVDDLSLNENGHIYIYDAAGNELQSNWGSGDFSANVKLAPNTEYYFKIYCSYSGTGNYTVTVTSKDDFYPNEQASARTIPLNTTISAAISGAYDVDFFKFTTESENAYYYFDVDDLSLNENGHIYIYDAAGNELQSNWGSGDFSANVKLAPNTEYYFKIYCSYSGTGNYRVTVTPDYDSEGDIKSQATPITINKTYTKKLSSSNDVDWYKLTLNGDCNVRFRGTNESGNQKYMYVYSAIDRQLVYNYFGGSFQKTVILDAGEYYIKFYGGSGYYSFAVGDCGSGHIEGTRYTKATDTADGIKTTYCKSCQTVIKKEVIPRINKVSLSYTKTTYNGKTKTPTVTVYDVKGNKISSSQYTVTYSSGRKNVGTYSVKVTFKGKYSGTETVKFKITPASSSKLKLSLSTTSYHYDGKAKKPKVTVKDSAGRTISSVYYDVIYPTGRKSVGAYKIKIVFEGNYSGTEYISFKVNPAKSAVTKITAGSKKLAVKFAKVTSGAGYQIQYSTSKSFKSATTKTVKGYKTTSLTLKGLKAKKTYYVRVRSYKKVNSKTYYSAWSSIKYGRTK